MPLGSTPLALAYSAAAQKEAEEQEGKLEKVHPHDDPTQWEYRVMSGKSQGTVGSCQTKIAAVVGR